MLRPTGDGSHVQTLPSGLFGRIRKPRGRRQLLYCPGLFFKIARSEAGRAALAREHAAAIRAARSAFWRPLVARNVRIFGHGFVARRHRPATSADFDRLVPVVEGLLEAALAFPAACAREDSERHVVIRMLPASDRSRLAAALAGFQLPATASHGDLHVFNFVFAGEAPRLVDWELFDPEGSFLFDYLDFFVSVTAINTAHTWPRILAELPPAHPAFLATSRRLDVNPEVLRLWYTTVKTGILMTLAGGPERAPHGERRRILAGLHRAVAALPAASRRPAARLLV